MKLLLYAVALYQLVWKTTSWKHLNVWSHLSVFSPFLSSWGVSITCFYCHIYVVKGVMETQLLTLVSPPSLADLSRLLRTALSGGNKHVVCRRGTEAHAGAGGDSWGLDCSFCCVSTLSHVTGMQQHSDMVPLENPIIISTTHIDEMAQLQKCNRNVPFACQMSD